MSTIKKALAKITNSRHGSKSTSDTPSGASTPVGSSLSAVTSATDFDRTNADGETAAQRQQRVDSQRSRSVTRARSRDPRSPDGLARMRSPDDVGRRARSQARPGARSHSRARRLSFTEERIKRADEKAKEDEMESKARKERMANAWKQVSDVARSYRNPPTPFFLSFFPQDALRDHYGDLPMNQSQERVGKYHSAHPKCSSI